MSDKIEVMTVNDPDITMAGKSIYPEDIPKVKLSPLCNSDFTRQELEVLHNYKIIIPLWRRMNMNTKKTTMRHRQAICTKRKIAKTAISLFRKYGYNSVSVNDICKKSNVSVGTFYHYFETKGAVFKTVIEDIDTRLFEYCANAECEKNNLAALLDFVVCIAKSHMEIEIDILTIWLSPEFQAIGDQAGEKTYSALLQLVEGGQKAGEITTELSGESIAQQVFVGTKGLLYDWCLHKGQYDLMSRIDEYCMILSRALKNDK